MKNSVKKISALKSAIIAATAAKKEQAATIREINATRKAIATLKTKKARENNLNKFDNLIKKLEAVTADLAAKDAAAVELIKAAGVPEAREARTEERIILMRARDFDTIIANAEKVRARLGRPFSVDEFESYVGVHITTAHRGKMSGNISISTPCVLNPVCVARMMRAAADPNSKSICGDCYAATLLKSQESIQIPLKFNFDMLNAVVLPADLWPILNARQARIEAFGDLGSVTQAINYMNFVIANPETDFAWFSKNLNFIKVAFKRLGISRPQNCQIVASVEDKDDKDGARKLVEKFPFVTKTFTVYEHAAGVKINCGARHCLTCGACYKPNPDGVAVMDIREQLHR